ncbi:MAG: PEP-CTERM sorting domain-containing protein [Pirellulaceae bacterium]
MITIKLGGPEYSGSGGNTLPENALQLIFEDAGTNKVKLTVDGTYLPPDTDKVTGVTFNVDPAIAGLKWTYISGVKAKSIDFAPNEIGGWGPAGKFDIGMDFKPGDFSPLDKSVYHISGTGLNTDDFLYKSSNLRYAAFHLNITGEYDNDENFPSGMYSLTSTVPEPTTLLMWLAFGSIGSVIAWRKSRKPA